MLRSPLLGVLDIDYEITQKFGERPNTYKQFGLNGHNGLDLAPVKKGQKTIVLAPHEGYVHCFDQGKKGYGRYVNISSLPYKLDVCRRSDLCHLQSFLVKDGQFVHSGDPIGVMGMTGFADGVHTHWTYKEMDRNGVTYNKDNGFLGALSEPFYYVDQVSGKLLLSR